VVLEVGFPETKEELDDQNHGSRAISSLMNRYLVVGADFSGAVLARELVEHLPCTVDIVDDRSHIGRNCLTFRDERFGTH
jgi:hypothetical protein